MEDILEALHRHQRLMKPEGAHPLSYIRDMVLAAIVELGEFLAELPWKPWKREEDQKENLEAAQEELADAIIFLLNAAKALKIDYGLKNVILYKINKNTERLASGDHATHKS